MHFCDDHIWGGMAGVGLLDLNVDLVGVLIVLSFLDLSWLLLRFPGYDAGLTIQGI